MLGRSGGGWTVPVTASDRFGRALAFGGSSTSPTLAFGTPGDDEPGRANRGSVYAVALDADGAVANDRFGSSVWLSGAGDLLVVGSPFATVGGVSRGRPAGNGRRAASARSGCRAARRGWKGPSLPFA